MKRLVAMGAVLFSLLSIVPAASAELTAPSITKSVTVAQQFWHSTMPVHLNPATPAQLASFTRSPGATAGTYRNYIWLSTTLLTNTYQVRMLACTTLVHEYGHALGLQHNANPLSIMFWQNQRRVLPWGCYKAFLPKGKSKQWRQENGGSPIWAQR
jgi:hypothetical protein